MSTTEQPLFDPHLHFFELEDGEYDWLKPESAPFWPDKAKIAKSFTLSQLHSEIDDTSMTKSDYRFVHIEAGFNNEDPKAEIIWLEAHMRGSVINYRSIACCHLLLSPELFKQQIKELESYSSVVGVRDILDEQAVDYLAMPSVKDNLAWLATRGLIFECQCDCSDPLVVEQMCLFLAANPEARWVINHCGGKVFTDGSATDEHWVTLAQLATFPNVYIKASGWEMYNRDFSWSDVEITVAALVDIWGKERVMIASNFPLLTWRMSYAEFWEGMAERFVKTPELLYKNAERVYFR